MKQRRAQPEYHLQAAVAAWLHLQYPTLLFASDVKGSLRLTVQQAVRFKKLQKPDFAHPDLVIYAMRHGYGGMFLELKAESPYRNDGSLRKDDHLDSQMRSMVDLRASGYHAEFYWDFEQIQQAVRWYLRGAAPDGPRLGHHNNERPD